MEVPAQRTMDPRCSISFLLNSVEAFHGCNAAKVLSPKPTICESKDSAFGTEEALFVIPEIKNIQPEDWDAFLDEQMEKTRRTII